MLRSFLGEPGQGLDRAHRVLFLWSLEGLLSRGGTTIAYVTRRSDEIPGDIRRVPRLENGRARMGSRAL
jgi:ABC-type molybdenum transport system ATPase subunit/photorepair protein PhrA